MIYEPKTPTAKFTVNFNDPGWDIRPYGDEKMEHYHKALTWCYHNKIKYKVKKKVVYNQFDGDGFDEDSFDDFKWLYKIGFYSESDALMFLLAWGEM